MARSWTACQCGASVQLITICFSHYNERARWALAHHGVPVVERRYMPGFHAPAVRRATRGAGRSDKLSSKLSTPVLVRDDGSCLCDSAQILRSVDAEHGTPENTLYPAEHREAIEAFEASIEQRFGGDSRRVAYHVLLGDPAMMGQLADRNVSARQARAFRFTKGVVGRMINKGLGVTPERSLRSLGRVEDMFAAVGERLGDKPFLFADRFTAADLTWACMAAPVLLPQTGYGAWLPDLTQYEHPLQPRLHKLADTVAGKHGHRMFAEFRPPSP